MRKKLTIAAAGEIVDHLLNIPNSRASSPLPHAPFLLVRLPSARASRTVARKDQKPVGSRRSEKRVKLACGSTEANVRK
jgi:hypothetical protein